MNKVLPLKRFGQNFLQDQNIIRKIITEIDPQDSDCLLYTSDAADEPI